MWVIAIPIVSVLCAAISFVQLWRTKKAARELQEFKGEFDGFREFYEWGGATRIVVRNKLDHVDMYDAAILQLFLDHKNGRFYRNARLLFDSNDMKVYAAGKREE